MSYQHAGYWVIGRVKGVKGKCSYGHKTGDVLKLDSMDAKGLCGNFFYQLFPYILMLQFGGKFPDAWGGDVIELDCMDKENAVTIELRPQR